MNRTRRWVLPTLLLLAGAALAVPGVNHLSDALWQRPAIRSTVVVPDQFLRRWDPVTVFFDDGQVDRPGPADVPDKYARLSPAHPGAWQWLDRRTLQFRPAEPWPALQRFAVRADGRETTLATLMTPPSRTVPRDGADGLEPVSTIRLTFPSPVPAAALARMITLELRAAPGLGDGPVQRLGAEDFTVKALQRPNADAPAQYTLTLRRPIPAGVRATMRFALSLDDSADSVTTVSFSTREPFRVRRLGCRGGEVPVGPEGGHFSKAEPLRCRGSRKLFVEFTGPLGEWGPIEGRTLVRFEPAVKNAEFRARGRRLEISGDFARETPYKVTVRPAPLEDRGGRPLELRGEASAWMYFPRQSPYLRWQAAHGIAEVGGPQRVPLEGRGHGRADLRIHRIDPLDRTFWPFPNSAPSTDETSRPPSPGEMPQPWTDPARIPRGELSARLGSLGSPGVSTLVDLPLSETGDAASFGLDLAPHLRRLAGAAKPGHYLVGLRLLDGSTRRNWLRLQVTDLSLTTVEGADDVRFVVTSLASGRPVNKALVQVQASVKQPDGEMTYETLFEGRTDREGMLRWAAPGKDPMRTFKISRLVVGKGADRLVIDPIRPPEQFRDGHWSSNSRKWLSWTTEDLEPRKERARRLCHLFTERPMYRPEHPVHVRGWLRSRFQGSLEPIGALDGRVEIRGPGGAIWKMPVKTSDTGGFYARWAEDDPPTGVYEALFMIEEEPICRADFQVEAYRLPKFKVDLSADETVPLDRPFQARLMATYYAGGQVAEAPISWRVTQYPYGWTPEPRDGFVYSSDGRYSPVDRFDSVPATVQEGLTGAQGDALIELDPSVEPTAAPRTYVIEATITGDDDQTVTAVERVRAVPAFALGLKVPRYQPEADMIRPEIIVAGPDGELLPGVEVQVKLKRRAWHAHLQASDFSHGEARYVTDIVDEDLRTETVTSAAEPSALELPIDRAGVYLVELEARDRLGRAQVVTVDLYAGGTGAIAWDKPKAGVFELSSDRETHAPGQTARVVIQSPFRAAEALVVIETPTGNRYRWVPVRDGKGAFDVKIDGTYAPRLPVHVVLMRGRVEAAKPSARSGRDLGKPNTVASTLWLTVEPRANQVQVTLDHPQTAAPGQTVPMTVKLADPAGEPRAGEVTLWLVDAAVLALADEARLDPLPDYITRRSSRVAIRDTRNLGFGRIPYNEMPGGGDGDEDDEDALDRLSVRRNFQPVPYYEASLKVPESGTLTVQVKLPDNLTVFAVRAKAASGPDRFGAAASDLAVRLPLLVQPALPRFVRPGDAFTLAAVGRVVEGEGGPGAAKLTTDGLVSTGEDRQTIDWVPKRPQRITWPVTTETASVGPDGEPLRRRVRVKVAANRAVDGIGDAFEVGLPLRPDRRPIHRRRIVQLEPGQPVTLEALPEAARRGTVRRTLVLSTEPALVRMAAALDTLRRQPGGNTEQRLTRARALLGTRSLRQQLMLGDADALANGAVQDALAWMPQVQDDRGLLAYWPGGEGRVALTAWAAHFLSDAEQAGFKVDPKLEESLTRALRQSLRSDAGWFIARWHERALALDGLAHLDQLDTAYFGELARNAQYLGFEALSGVVMAAQRGSGAVDGQILQKLVESVAGGVTVRLYRGKEIYSGLQGRGDTLSPLIHPSETRTLAQMTRALVAHGFEGDRLRLMVDALVRLGTGDGWGSSATDGPALLALAEWMASPVEARKATVELGISGATERFELGSGPTARVASKATLDAPEATLTLADGEGPAVALEMVRYVPEAPAEAAEAESEGFVVSRRWLQPQPEGPATKTAIEGPGQVLNLSVGDVVEGHVRVINPDARHYVAITAPLAAGVEPLNPRLATAPPEATPSGQLTATPTFVQHLDDRVVWHYETLPKGTYDFYYRVKATVPGRFGQPPARAAMSYDRAVRGRSPGAAVSIARAPGQ